MVNEEDILNTNQFHDHNLYGNKLFTTVVVKHNNILLSYSKFITNLILKRLKWHCSILVSGQNGSLLII